VIQSCAQVSRNITELIVNLIKYQSMSADNHPEYDNNDDHAIGIRSCDQIMQTKMIGAKYTSIDASTSYKPTRKHERDLKKIVSKFAEP
jgi:hypothetical protein